MHACENARLQASSALPQEAHPAPLLPWVQVAAWPRWQNCDDEDKRTQANWANWFWPTPPVEFICFTLHIYHCWSLLLSFPSCSCANTQITKPPYCLKLYKEDFPSPDFACAMLNLRATCNTNSLYPYNSTWLWHTILPAEFERPCHMQVHNPFQIKHIFSPAWESHGSVSILSASTRSEMQSLSLIITGILQ